MPTAVNCYNPTFSTPKPPPQRSLAAIRPTTLGGQTQLQLEYLVPFDQIAALRWSPASFFDCASCREPFVSAPASGPIGLVVTDYNGCTDSLATWVGVDARRPYFRAQRFSPNGD
ncbi:MAG: hypothetical protein HC821_00990, partial [Lewinella sp.]|nr:hypothetical protein [Lewinella sp.]